MSTKSLRWAVAFVWLVHGLYNKLLGGSPRHLAIVQSMPGFAGAAGVRLMIAVGVCEVGLALWMLSGRALRACAATQTVVLLAMNVLELTFARPLLISPLGLIPLNVAFLSFAWIAAGVRWPEMLRTRLRRHPVAIEAHFDDCLTLTYAVPADVLRPLVPRGLELDTDAGYAFIAVALVQTRALRPAHAPQWCGQDFFLAGYRVFTTFEAHGGRRLRGLRILRSDANRRSMVIGGNLLTHYNYHRCDANLERRDNMIRVTVATRDGYGDVDVSADLDRPELPAGSPFSTLRDARRFAGPLPFTFDYEPDSDSIVSIEARRSTWKPTPVRVDVRRLAFFEQPMFHGCAPVLAAAFYVGGVDYRWNRGVRHPLHDDERAGRSRCAA